MVPCPAVPAQKSQRSGGMDWEVPDVMARDLTDNLANATTVPVNNSWFEQSGSMILTHLQQSD